MLDFKEIQLPELWQQIADEFYASLSIEPLELTGESMMDESTVDTPKLSPPASD